MRHEGSLRQAQGDRKYRLSPNGGERGFDKLSPNGSLRTLNVAFGPQRSRHAA
jgi:hypothetical protein